MTHPVRVWIFGPGAGVFHPADGCRQALDLVPPAVGEETNTAHNALSQPDVGAVGGVAQHRGIDDGRAGHVGGEPGGRRPGEPGCKQADRPGQFDCSDEGAEPLACSDCPELLHRAARAGQLGRGSNEKKNAPSRICAAQSSVLVRGRGLASGAVARAVVVITAVSFWFVVSVDLDVELQPSLRCFKLE